MSKAMMRDEDAQVIQMVNTRTADRRRRAEETAAKMVVIAEDRQARDEDFCRRKMQLGRVAECAGKAALGALMIGAVQQGLVVSWMGLALAAVCFIWTAVSWKGGRV